ncbi:hypothetical protein Tco_0344998 [Tanacetum coccineum]
MLCLISVSPMITTVLRKYRPILNSNATHNGIGTSTLFDITNASATDLCSTSSSETAICSKEKKLHADGCHQFPPNKANIPLTPDMIQHLYGRVNVSFNGDTVKPPSPRVTNREHTHVTRRTQRVRRCRTSQPEPIELHLMNGQPTTTSNRVPLEFAHLGKCTCVCRHCGAMFWECEKNARSSYAHKTGYNKCCYGGRVVLRVPPEYPEYIKQLYRDPHFIDNIRAYNQMFSMTSLGANVDSSINNGRGPYVFRISGQNYHWIGSMCLDEGNPPRFLQLYIHDTSNEVNNHMANFGGEHEGGLKREIMEDLIEFLDNNNALVHLFHTARSKYMEGNIPEFKVRLYNVIGTRQYELPIAETIGAIVFGGSLVMESKFDLIMEEHSCFPQRVNKLHPCYMSLQFPLLFVYGEEGYQKDMKLLNVPGQSMKADKRMSMNMYYLYQIHDRLNHYNLLSRGGKLFQQYIVIAYCAIKQSRLDYPKKQSNIRNEYLSGLYDAIMRGDRDESDLGMRTILTASFTGNP